MKSTYIISTIKDFKTFTEKARVSCTEVAGYMYENKANQSFEQEMSFAVTSTARMKFEDRRFRQVIPLVDQNIGNDVATSEDYILKVNCLLALYNDDQTNMYALDMIDIAKSLDAHNINIYKAEILANLRLKKYHTVQELLEQYIPKLNEMELSLKEIESDKTWDANYNFIISERDWAKRMIVKVKAMQ